MNKLAWAIWIYALIYNIYGAGLLTPPFFRFLPPTSLDTLRSEAMLIAPAVTLIAMLWSLTWRTKIAATAPSVQS
jgi:hypothetical protein